MSDNKFVFLGAGEVSEPLVDIILESFSFVSNFFIYTLLLIINNHRLQLELLICV